MRVSRELMKNELPLTRSNTVSMISCHVTFPLVLTCKINVHILHTHLKTQLYNLHTPTLTSLHSSHSSHLTPLTFILTNIFTYTSGRCSALVNLLGASLIHRFVTLSKKNLRDELYITFCVFRLRSVAVNIHITCTIVTFSGFSVGCCINTEVICYQLEFGK